MIRPLAIQALICAAALGAVQFSAAQEERPAGEGEPVKDAATEINVKNADLETIIRIFSKKTKRNYILDERVKGKVSIYLPGKVSSDEAIRILDSVLQLKGFTSVPISENLYKIVPAREAKTTTIPTVDEIQGAGMPTVVTRLINVKYVSADDIKQLLSPLVSPFGLINAYTGTNSLIIIDAEENIKRLVKLIEELDVPFSDREMIIIPIKHAEAAKLAETIKELLSEDGDKEGASPSERNIDFMRSRLREAAAVNRPGVPPGAGGEAAGGEAAAVTVGARARAPKILADERTNAIIVVADEDTAARIRALVAQLDSSVDLAGIHFYVYRVQHGNAEELAEVLSSLTGGGGTTSGGLGTSSSRRESGLLGQRNEQQGGGLLNRRNSSSSDRLASQRRTPGQSRASTTGATGPSTVSLNEELSITADPSTNSLVIVGTKTEYEKILKLLKELDIKRRQVLVEALLLEVRINDTLRTGTEWITSAGGQDGGVLAMNNLANLPQLFSDPRQLSQFTLAAASAGSLTLPGGITIPTQTILLTAASQAENVNVLSAPTILATDNEDAEIVVGENVPFLASTASSQENLNNVFNQIDRQDVGITLRLTPQISSREFVTLTIFTEVSSVIPGTVASELGPTTTIRTSETTVIAKNGQMIVIGGLIADNIQESDAGVPYLRNIPVLGHLFQEHSAQTQRNNLLIFITPRIIQDQFDIRETSIEMRDHVEDFIEFRDVQPTREEVLHDRNIDRVTESEVYKGKKPSTVLPPEKKSAGRPVAPRAAIEAPIALKVTPRLPEAADIQDSRAIKMPSDDQGLYVVLKAADLPASGELPFAVSPDKLVGLTLPKESRSGAKTFFAAGADYGYELDSKLIPLKVLGVFGAESEAKKFFPDLPGDWHTLSPYEIMNLGRGPWVSGGR